MPADIILKYFTDLTVRQQEQLEALDALYHDWNAKINVISRKDIDQLYEHHVLHSLAIAKAIRFRPGTRILDFGTGGGFPGIPLAILFPDCEFKLIDGTGKKVRVAQEISQAIGLTNCHPEHLRGEDEKGLFHFVVSRAVMPLPDLVKIVRKNIIRQQRGGKNDSVANALPNGILCLKGGDLQAETQPFRNIIETTDISSFFQEEWFKGKHIIYLPIN
jgi:16S rRNA (guanine527-N7)-methyltransferase